MSKYIKLYEAMCPRDVIIKYDPRREDIIYEMRKVIAAKSAALAALEIEWWGEWPNEDYDSAEEFCKAARRKWKKLKGA